MKENLGNLKEVLGKHIAHGTLSACCVSLALVRWARARIGKVQESD